MRPVCARAGVTDTPRKGGILLRIGFFIPEFPGQTHIFLWRERQALAELGVEADLISTRPPPRAVASHSWAAEAQAQTRYLLPLRGEGLGMVTEFLRAGPTGWARGLGAAFSAATWPAIFARNPAANALPSIRCATMAAPQLRIFLRNEMFHHQPPQVFGQIGIQPRIRGAAARQRGDFPE